MFPDHSAAERVVTRLVGDGFPTDRVELTSRAEPGRAGLVPADTSRQQLTEYFSQLFGDEQEGGQVRELVTGVLDGEAAVTVHPRGDIETRSALKLLQNSGAIAVHTHDLEKQGMEHAASSDETPVVSKVLGRDPKVRGP
jgi:hypothetical protein